MKLALTLSVVLLVGSSVAMAQKPPLEGVGSKNMPPAPAGNAYGGIKLPSTSEGLDIPRVEIFGSYSMLIPAPSWGLPSNTRGVGFDTSGSFNLTRWFAAEGDIGWNRAWAEFGTVQVTDHGLSVSGGPRITYRQGRLAVFSHALFGTNKLTIGSTISGIQVLGVSFPGSTITDTSMAEVLGAGADIAVSTHLALRNQVDYIPTHHLSQIQNNHRFLLGFVLKL